VAATFVATASVIAGSVYSNVGVKGGLRCHTTVGQSAPSGYEDSRNRSLPQIIVCRLRVECREVRLRPRTEPRFCWGSEMGKRGFDEGSIIVSGDSCRRFWWPPVPGMSIGYLSWER
jgi:hypothetical protein